MRRRSNLDFEKRRRSRKTGYRRRKAKKKGFGNLPKAKKKIHLNLEMIASTFTWIFKIVVTCLVAFVAVWYWGQRVSTVGDSMSPVLKNADVVLVNRIVYNASSPKRGDVIVFKPKGNENSHYYTKRIVGLPGETVQIVENQVYINGKKLEEDYKTTKIDTAGIAGEKLKLGGDEYFVLGDNRKNSEDSRSADIGKVKRSYIYGKAWFVASTSSITRSINLIFSCIMRFAFVMCPGYH